MELVDNGPSNSVLVKTFPGRSDYLACILNVLLFGVLVWSVLNLSKRRDSRWWLLGRLSLLAIGLLTINSIRILLYTFIPALNPVLRHPALALLRQRGASVVLSACALALFSGFTYWRKQILAASRVTLLCLFPLVPLMFMQGLWKTVRPDHTPHKAVSFRLPQTLGQRQSGRVVWIVFDEWDYRLTFVKPPTFSPFNELDRFRRAALYATQAYSPARRTDLSMPSMILGKRVVDMEADGSDITLTLLGRERLRWGGASTVFSMARQEGFETAVVGWGLPYCAVLKSSLDTCWWSDPANQANSMGDGFANVLVNQGRSLFETANLSPFGQSLASQRHARDYERILERAKVVVSAPGVGLALLHFPVPHSPFVYNPVTKHLNLTNSPVGGYLKNLILVDQTVGEVRKSMEAAGLWESSTVLLTGDHSFRNSRALDGQEDYRVPFLLKLANQQDAVDYSLPFNNTLVHDLLLAVLDRSVRDTQSVTTWLDLHRSQTPVQPIRGLRKGGFVE